MNSRADAFTANDFHHARWIWGSGESSPRNRRLRFRQNFEIPPHGSRDFSLLITADSRYRLYLNGVRLGFGPVRAFPRRLSFDVYSLRDLLREGSNQLAVEVHHYGESTFQYLAERGGLLLTLLDQQRRPLLVSDGSWRTSVCDAFEERAPRTSCQLGFEEQFDARREDGWEEPGYDDSAWEPAGEIGVAGCAPWLELTERSIPFLTHEAVSPQALLQAEYCESTETWISFEMKRPLFPDDRSSNRMDFRAVAAAALFSPEDQPAELPRQQTPDLGAWRLNGALIPSPGRQASTVRLRRGWNLLTAELVGEYHENEFALFLHALPGTRFGAPEGWKSRSCLIGPLASGTEVRRVAAALCEAGDIVAGTEPVIWISEDNFMFAADVTNTVLTQRSLPGLPAVEAGDDFSITLPASDVDISVTIDFGRELIGFIVFEIDAPAGTVVDGYCFEGMLADGPQYMERHRPAFRYTAAGGTNRWESSVRRGFRYLTLTFRNLTDTVCMRGLTLFFTAFPARKEGAFSCSDQELNGIWEIGAYTLLCCMEDTFTDCPAYEQTMWVGDARNESLVNYAASGDWDLVRRNLLLPADSPMSLGVPESQVPSGWSDIIPAWNLLWIQTAGEYYLYTGDLEAIRAILPVVVRTVDFFLAHRNRETGLVEIDAWNFFDWSPVDTGYTCLAYNSILLCEALARAAVLLRAAGREVEADNYLEKRTHLIDSINTRLWSPAAGAYIDSLDADGTPGSSISQATNTLALLYDIAPEPRAGKIERFLAHDHEGIPMGTPFATFFRLDALMRMHREEQVLAEIRRLWGGMIAAGATTFWEHFEGSYPDGPTRSYCHAWSSAPTFFLSRMFLGIAPEAPGFARMQFQPHFLTLEHAAGSVPTPAGAVSVAWRRNGDGIDAEITLPPGCECRCPESGGLSPVLRDQPGGEVEKTAGRSLELHGGASYRLYYR